MPYDQPLYFIFFGCFSQAFSNTLKSGASVKVEKIEHFISLGGRTSLRQIKRT